jgi:hypothetical protein
MARQRFLKARTMTDCMPSARKRIAHCCCGALRAETIDEPIVVAACSCQECQRRTGSAFGIGTFWSPDKVKIEGNATRFVRTADSGGRVVSYFCPQCGSTVYWEIPDLRPGWLAIAGGAFGHPDFPPPTMSIWERFKHEWVSIPVSQHLNGQPD